MTNNIITKEIAYNCKKATFLIEKKQAGAITFREKLELKLHLAGCSVCRIYQQQSIMINKMLKFFFIKPDEPEIKLDDKYKEQMQLHIEERLNRNKYNNL